MLKITAHKIAQFPERYPGEGADQEFGDARDQYQSDQYDINNVFFIRETFLDPTTGQETEHVSDDGYASVEEAESIAQSSLQNSIEGGAIEVDIVHRDEGWQKTVWSRAEEPTSQPMAQPMPQPMAQPMPKPMQVPFPR